jgi:hypothetical protein
VPPTTAADTTVINAAPPSGGIIALLSCHAIGIDLGKNSFHIVGHDQHGAIVLRQKWSRSQVETRLANLPPCLIGMEACVGAHHLNRKLQVLGHDARLRSDNECSEGKGDGSE